MHWTWWRSIGLRGPQAQPDSSHWLRFALVGRDAPPASLLAQLETTDVALATRLRQAWAADLARVEGVLAREDSDIADALPTPFFSTEHHWAVLMERLKVMPGITPNDWRRALQHYAAFLRACIQLTTRLLQQRGQHPGSELSTVALFREPESATRIPAERLGPGEAREFRLRADQALRLRLGNHDFTLVLRPQPALQDDSGRSLPLPQARCQVGRHSGCELTLGDDYPSVSRRHVLIELLAGERVRLTDTSSYGTWVLQPQLASAELRDWSEAPRERAAAWLTP